MAYAGALAFLRELAHCDWRSQPSPLGDIALSFTVHSLKATLLSWGPQLHEVVSKEVRLAQGHHKDSNQSLDLYGRDSVWGSLQFQQIVINQVRAGFRPQIAQHRGAQAPLIEPPVSLEAFKKEIPQYTWKWFDFNSPSGERVVEVDLPDCVEEDSSSDSSSSSDDSVQETNPAVSKRSQPPVVDEVLMAKYRTVVHALLDDLESTETDSATQLLRTACGRKLPKFATVVIDSIDSTLTLRQHSGVITAVSSAMDEPGESSPLEDLLARSGVPAILSSRLLAEGWTLDSFACSATSMTQFDDILPELLPSEEVSLLHKAALRLAFKQAHEAIYGVSDQTGLFKSRATACYPTALATAFAFIVQDLLSDNPVSLSLDQAIFWIPSKPRAAPPFGSEDGGGLPSVPDWSMDNRVQPDVFRSLRRTWVDEILTRKLHKELVAHFASGSKTPPFSEETLAPFRQSLNEFLSAHGLSPDWSIREHQPMALRIMRMLHSIQQDWDVSLFPSLEE
ncbi:unnamed protein product, partial [Durusdinium trenchii]